jgi:hypothetical protein
MFILIDRSISDNPRNIWLQSRKIVLIVDIEIWNSNDVWWGNMQVTHPLIRDFNYFPKCINNQPMGCNCSTYFRKGFLAPFVWSTFHQQRYPELQRWLQAHHIIDTRIHALVIFLNDSIKMNISFSFIYEDIQ